MSDNFGGDHDERHSAHTREEQVRQPEHDASLLVEGQDKITYSGALLGDARLEARGNVPVRASVMERGQQTHGNHAMQRSLGAPSASSVGRSVQRFSMPSLGGFSMPDLGSMGIGKPFMPDLGGLSMPSLGGFSMPDLGSMGIGKPFMPDLGGIGMPDLGGMGMPDLGSMGIGKPFMPDLGGLPSFGMPDLGGLPSPGDFGIGKPFMPDIGGLSFPDIKAPAMPSIPDIVGSASDLVGLGAPIVQGGMEGAFQTLGQVAGSPVGGVASGIFNGLGAVGGLASAITGGATALDPTADTPDRVVGGLNVFSGAVGALGAIGSMAPTALPSLAALAPGAGIGGLGAEAGVALGLGEVGTGLAGAGGIAGAGGAAGLLGTGAAVIGAGAAGYGIGRLLDKGSGWVGDQVSRSGAGEALGMNPGGDYSISGLIGKGLYGIDEGISNMIDDDPNKPAYQKTLAYKINNWLDD